MHFTVASCLLSDEDYTDKIKDLLIPLFDDPDEQVRQESRSAFHNDGEILSLPQINSFMRTFLKSQAFRDDPTGVLFSFEKYPGNLVQFSDLIFTICEQFAGPLADKTRDYTNGLAGDISYVSSLLLRLYEQSINIENAVANKCLDMWDLMFEKRIGTARELMKSIEK